MSFHQKTVTVSLLNFTLLLGFVLFTLSRMMQTGTIESAELFRLWTIVIVWAVVVTILLLIAVHVGTAVWEAARTGNNSPEIDDLVDERDTLIDLKGTKRTYQIASLGGLIAMLTFALGQSPLIMFSVLLVSGLLAQIIGDVTRLLLYQEGM